MPSAQEFLERFKSILSISHIPIVMRRDRQCQYPAELEWHPDQERWCIWYKDFLSKYYIIHELGHLYLSNITSFQNFAIQTPDHKHIDRRLHPLFNNLLDVFVDFRLSQFEEIYPFLKNKYLENISKNKEFMDLVAITTNLIKILSWYVIYYIDFRFTLKERDLERRALKPMKELRTYIIKKGGSPINMTEEKFENLDEQLDRFDEFKDGNSPKRIVLYIINVVYCLRFWTKEQLLKQAKLYFFH